MGAIPSFRRTPVLPNGNPVSELRLASKTRTGGKSKSQERFANDAGDINASSVKELQEKVGGLIDTFLSGGLVVEAETSENHATQQERAAALMEALADASGAKMRVMGDTIVEELVEVGKREGFLRSLLGVQPVGQGQDAKVRIKYKQGVAVVATGPNTVKATKFKERYVIPPAYYLQAHLLIEDAEVRLSPVGVMEEIFEDGLESTMVAEDRLGVKLWKALDGIFNTPIAITGSLTPEIWATMREAVEGFGIVASTAVMAYDYWKDISGGSVFSAYFDPVSKYQLVLEGRLGQLMGINIITDAFREDKLQVLSPGELFIVGPPQNLGTITQHQEMTPFQIDRRAQGEPYQGWFLQAIQGTVCPNPRALIRAYRL